MLKEKKGPSALSGLHGIFPIVTYLKPHLSIMGQGCLTSTPLPSSLSIHPFPTITFRSLYFWCSLATHSLHRFPKQYREKRILAEEREKIIYHAFVHQQSIKVTAEGLQLGDPVPGGWLLRRIGNESVEDASRATRSNEQQRILQLPSLNPRDGAQSRNSSSRGAPSSSPDPRSSSFCPALGPSPIS